MKNIRDKGMENVTVARQSKKKNHKKTDEEERIFILAPFSSISVHFLLSRRNNNFQLTSLDNQGNMKKQLLKFMLDI